MDCTTQLHVRLAVAENELFHARSEAHCAREANRFIIENIVRQNPLYHVDSGISLGPQAAGDARTFRPAQANLEKLQARLEQVEQENRDLKARIKELLAAQHGHAEASSPILQDWTQGRVLSGRTLSPPFYTNHHIKAANIYDTLMGTTNTTHPQMFKPNTEKHSHRPTLDLLEGRVTSILHPSPADAEKVKTTDPHGRTLLSYAESDHSDEEVTVKQEEPRQSVLLEGEDSSSDEVRDHDDGNGEDSNRVTVGATKQECSGVADRPILKPIARLRNDADARMASLQKNEDEELDY